MKNSKIYALAAVFLVIVFIAASAYYFASEDSGVTGNAISLKSLFKKQITDSRVRIPPEGLIYSVNRSGVFASTRILGEEVNLGNLSLDIFRKPNMDYRAVIKWKLNVNPLSYNRFVDIYGPFFIDSTVTLFTNRTNRLTGIVTLAQAGVNQTLNPVGNVALMEVFSNIEITYSPVEEDKDYLILIETSVPGDQLQYNFTFKTPPVEPARVECNRIIDNGPAEKKFNIFFVPLKYSAEDLSTGRFEEDVRDVLYNAYPTPPIAGKGDVMNRRSLFGIPVFNKSLKSFNVFVINSFLPAPVAYNKLISIGKACSFNRDRDIFIMMDNIESGTAYAQGVGTGIWIDIPRGEERFKGKGAILSHEIAHLIGFDEEYYFWGEPVGISPLNAPNCEYGNLTCTKWCRGTNTELSERIHSAKRKSMQCKDIVMSRDTEAWQTFCPTLELAEQFHEVSGEDTTFYGATNIEELCSLPLSTSIINVCYEGTFIPLEDENIGIDCNTGYGCYLGCGSHYQHTKGSYVSIMGGGALGNDIRIYAQMDAVSPTPIMPDFSKADSDILERYFSQFTTRYELARRPIGRVPVRRIPPR